MTVGIVLRRSIDWVVLLAVIAAPPALTVLGAAVLAGLAAVAPGGAAQRLLRGAVMISLALAGTVIVYAAV